MRSLLLKKQHKLAKFMGWEVDERTAKVPNLYPVYNIKDEENTGWIQTDFIELEFLDRWDWLMPVIEKICLIKFEDGSNQNCYLRTFGMLTGDPMFMVRFNRFSLHTEETLIEAAFLAVIEVIEHYENKELQK